MAWTAPRTWVTNEVVTAALLNTHVRDNLLFLRSFHGVRSYKSATQTIGAGATDVITFNTDDYDTDATHDTVTNNSRFIVPSGFDGYWDFWFKLDGDADTTGNLTRRASLRKNAAGASGGGTALDVGPEVTSQVGVNGYICHWTGPLVAGDYVEAFFFAQTENVVAGSGTTGTIMVGHYLGS